MEKKPLIVLTGPTAVGKTKLSIRLAKAVDGEIISADSMQVYRHMDIGSAKISPDEMEGIPHHLIDVLEPDEEFNVVAFQRMAKSALEEICGRGRIPIIVGGTGFYIQALLYDVDFSRTDTDWTYRKELAEIGKKKGSAYLHSLLKEIDEKAAQEIHEHNQKRIIRALEYYHETGEKISEHNERERAKESPYRTAYFVLTEDREELYRRIDCRVEQMIEQGLIEEVANLKKRGLTSKMVSMQGLGYKELLSWMDHEISFEEAVSNIKRNTRHFAKRQITWFKREKDVIWLDKREFSYNEEKILDKILQILREKEIVTDKRG